MRKEIINMSEAQVQTIKDIIRMMPKLNSEYLNSIRILMQKELDAELLRLEPTVMLKNMDITEKVMYLDYLNENDETKQKEKEGAISLEEILKREGLTVDDLQDKD